ncbi:TauD/TfdA family dioxygenase [Nocardia sp. NPDC004711]
MLPPPILDFDEFALPSTDAAARSLGDILLDDLADRDIQSDVMHRFTRLVPGISIMLTRIRNALADDGLLLLRNIPANDDTLLVLLGAAAAPPATCDANGSRLVDHLTPVATGEARHKAQNQRSEMLLHTDASAQHEPPDIVGLACAANDGEGGGSVLVAIDDIVERMRQHGEESGIRLLHNDFPYIHPQRTDRPATLAPVLRDLGSGHLHVRYRKENLETGKSLAPDAVTDEAWAALDLFAHFLEDDTRPQTTLRLHRGDYLLFDNRRYLHGRGAIDPTAYRLLKRTYFTYPASESKTVQGAQR